MKRIAFGFIVVLLPISLVLVGAELMLRAFPSLISLPILDRFPVELKREVAQRLELPSTDDFRIISSAERTDRGDANPNRVATAAYADAIAKELLARFPDLWRR